MGGDSRKLTIIVQVLLVAFTASDLLLDCLSFFNGLFHGNNPAVTLLGVGCFEPMLLTTSLEREMLETLFRDD